MGRDEPCTRSVERLSAPANAELIHTASDSYLFRHSSALPRQCDDAAAAVSKRIQHILRHGAA